MPNFYGDRMDDIIKEGQTLDDAMIVTNSSADSDKAEYNNSDISEELIEKIIALSESDEDSEQ